MNKTYCFLIRNRLFFNLKQALFDTKTVCFLNEEAPAGVPTRAVHYFCLCKVTNFFGIMQISKRFQIVSKGMKKHLVNRPGNTAVQSPPLRIVTSSCKPFCLLNATN